MSGFSKYGLDDKTSVITINICQMTHFCEQDLNLTDVNLEINPFIFSRVVSLL